MSWLLRLLLGHNFFTLAPMVAKVASGKYIAFTYSQVLQDTRGMVAKVAVGIEP